MKGKESIRKIYIEKINKLKKHNELYFSKDKPLISDKQYDDLKKNILELEGKYSFLNIKFLIKIFI